MATLEQTKAALNAAASKHGFSCCPVSWEDAQRGTVGGALSCWGGNISDVRLWERSGTLLYTLRTNNFNERLGYVASRDVAVVVGNHVAGGSPPQPITLQRYLKQFGTYASYAAVEPQAALFDEVADQLLSIRFQAVFLPIATSTAVTEFCTEVYNYNTHADDDPRNVILLCTAQGTSVQQDGAGAKKVYLHHHSGAKEVHRYWLEAEQSTHKVGGAQLETDEEAAAAAARGKATAIHIGTKAMGTRFNVQMLIQMPLKQKAVAPQRYDEFEDDSDCFLESEMIDEEECGSCFSVPPPMPAPVAACAPKRKSCAPPPPPTGTSNAARVSTGSRVDTWLGVANKAPERDPSQHGTITVTLYYTVAGGVPSVADVEACIADIDALYKACPSDKRLVDCGEVTAELTVKAATDVQSKIVSQPYTPPQFPPTKSTFPEGDE